MANIDLSDILSAEEHSELVALTNKWAVSLSSVRRADVVVEIRGKIHSWIGNASREAIDEFIQNNLGQGSAPPAKTQEMLEWEKIYGTSPVNQMSDFAYQMGWVLDGVEFISSRQFGTYGRIVLTQNENLDGGPSEVFQYIYRDVNPLHGDYEDSMIFTKVPSILTSS